MNKPSDNAKLPESMKKACCEICTLAERMKDCKNCPFFAYKQSVTNRHNPVLYIMNAFKVNQLVTFINPFPDEIGLVMRVLEVNGDRLLVEYQVKNLEILPTGIVRTCEVKEHIK